MTDEELAAVRARWAAALAGPWFAVPGEQGQHFIEDMGGVIADMGDRVRGHDEQRYLDASAIAAAPTDVALLIGEVDRLRHRMALLEQALDAALGVDA